MKRKYGLSVLLALVMMLTMLTMGVPALAWPDNDGTYIVSSRAPYPTSGDITVHLKIMGHRENGEARTVFFDNPVTISGTYNVRQALLTADAADPNLTISWTGANYVSGINGQTYGETGTYSGWFFRVIHKVPFERAGWGADVQTALLKNGDYVYMWYDSPEYTKYTRVEASAGGGNQYTATAQYAYMTSLWNWTFSNFASLTTGDIVLYDLTDQAQEDVKSASSAIFDLDDYDSGHQYCVYYKGTYEAGGGDRSIAYTESNWVPLN